MGTGHWRVPVTAAWDNGGVSEIRYYAPGGTTIWHEVDELDEAATNLARVSLMSHASAKAVLQQVWQANEPVRPLESLCLCPGLPDGGFDVNRWSRTRRGRAWGRRSPSDAHRYDASRAEAEQEMAEWDAVLRSAGRRA